MRGYANGLVGSLPLVERPSVAVVEADEGVARQESGTFWPVSRESAFIRRKHELHCC